MKKIVVGMSGGVDSSVAAYLLKEQGFDVIGVTMNIWPESEKAGAGAVEDAAKVAEVLNIPHYVMDFKDIFTEKVIANFISEYRQGRTPNPCIVCNRFVKWEALLKRSAELGADYIATGHYARIKKLPNGRYAVAAASSAEKDQTYALYNLTQEQLSHTLMPLGEYDKETIRKIAQEQKLPVANKPDSQDICFVPDGDYAGFICAHSDYRDIPGNFVDLKGNILGTHRGLIHYTVGQRKGLGIAFGEPMFVVRLDPLKNEVILGRSDEVFSGELLAENINCMGTESFAEGQRVLAKVRYSHRGSLCTLHPGNGTITCTFDEPVRAITPGQAVVFYEDGAVLGGGIIKGDARFLK